MISRALIAVLLLSATARANDFPTVARRYFEGERMTGMAAFTVGGAQLTLGTTLLATSDDRTARAASWLMVGFGAVEVLGGAYLMVNSEPRVEALVRDFAAAPGPTVARERARMERWSRWFKALMVVEIAVTAVGLGLGLGGQFGANSPTLTGIGYTLAAEAATVFVFDLTASRRARVYLDALRAM